VEGLERRARARCARVRVGARARAVLADDGDMTARRWMRRGESHAASQRRETFSGRVGSRVGVRSSRFRRCECYLWVWVTTPAEAILV